MKISMPEFMKKRQKRVLLISVGIIALAFILGFTAHKHTQPAEEIPHLVLRKGDKIIIPATSPLRQQLIVKEVQQSALPHTISLPAVVAAEPTLTVNILPPLSGRLTEINVHLGDMVTSGEILAVISSPELEQNFADYDKAKATLALAQQIMTRVQNVNKAGGNAAKDLEIATNNFLMAQVEYNRTQLQLKTLGITDPDSTTTRTLVIKSPISGTITALDSGIGSYITDTTASLMTISKLDKIWVIANVPENYLNVIAAGQSAEVTLSAYPGKLFPGKIDYINAILDPASRRAEAGIEFSNPTSLFKPNMYATVNVAIPQVNQIIVPASALLMNNDSTTVFVEVAPWTFIRREVEIGSEDGENVHILSGLAKGDKIIMHHGILIND